MTTCGKKMERGELKNNVNNVAQTIYRLLRKNSQKYDLFYLFYKMVISANQSFLG